MDERAREVIPNEPIRVLFISQNCQVQHYTERTEYAYWYEGAFAFYAGSRAHVGIAYEETDEGESGLPRALSSPPDLGITYYPLKVNLRHGATGQEWEAARSMLLGVIDQFQPDVVQCFGSEWPHAAIAEDIDIPVVVHMMGFLNIYYPTVDMAVGYHPIKSMRRAIIRKLLPRGRKHDSVRAKMKSNAAFERRVMRANHYFMGRTEWDKNIVKYYSPGSRYFEVPELLRFPFMREAGSWHSHSDGRVRLLTTASADERKGIEIVLKAAKLLKELIGLDFEWRIAGSKEGFARFEKRCGIRHNEVGVRLLGMLEAEELVNELKNANLFVHPSIIDNSPRAICEAQLVGCPTISSNVGGVPQLVEHGVTGFLYPYNEPHTLAFLVANLAHQSETLAYVSKAALRVAQERHNPQAIIDQTLEVYREVIVSHEE